MLSKSVSRLGALNMQFNHNLHGQSLLRQSVRSFAAGGQYDVCVIGGGPGGKLKFNFLVAMQFLRVSRKLSMGFILIESHFDSR